MKNLFSILQFFIVLLLISACVPAKKYKDLGISVRLIHLSQECQVLLLKAEPSLSDIIETSVDDPRYYVMSDLLEEN